MLCYVMLCVHLVCWLTVAEKQLDRRMHLSARFPADAWQPAQAYFSTSLTDSVC